MQTDEAIEDQVCELGRVHSATVIDDARRFDSLIGGL